MPRPEVLCENGVAARRSAYPPSFSPSSSPFSPFSSSPSPSLDKEVGLGAKLSLADNLGQHGYGNHICIICDDDEDGAFDLCDDGQDGG